MALVEVICNPEHAGCRRRVTLSRRGHVLGRRKLGHFNSFAHSYMPVKLKRPLPRHGIVRITVTGTDVGNHSSSFDNDSSFKLAWRVRR